MAKGIGTGNAEGSRRSLDEYREGTQFKVNDERTRILGQIGGTNRAANQAVNELLSREIGPELAATLIAFVKTYFVGRCSLDEIRKAATSGDCQAIRTMALESTNPKKAMAFLQWLVELVWGKPTQRTETEFSGDLNVSKPSIVFNDVEGASRKGEEERLQSEEEDI